MIIDYLTHTLRHSLFLIVSMELIFSFTYHMKYKMIMRNSRENSAESTASLLADPSSKKTATAPMWINNAFVLLAFAMSLAGCVASPTLRGNLLLLPFILLLVDSELDTNEWMELVVNKCRLLIPPFVLVSVIKLVFEVAEMKAPINKQNMDWLYYLRLAVHCGTLFRDENGTIVRDSGTGVVRDSVCLCKNTGKRESEVYLVLSCLAQTARVAHNTNQ